MALLMTRAPIRVQSTTGTALTVTAVTKADPGVATATGHGLTTGDVVRFAVSTGMLELDYQTVRVIVTSTDEFELENLNTTNFSDWVSGTAIPISTWHTLCFATGVDLPNNPPNKVTTTNLCSYSEETSIGLSGEVSGSIPIQDTPGSAALKALSELPAGSVVSFKHTWDSGEEKVFSAQPVYGGGYSGNVGDVTTGQIDVTLKGRIISYAAP